VTHTGPLLPSIAQLNLLSGADFARALRPLFESAEPLTAALERTRPYGSYEALLDRAGVVLRGMPEAEQVEVLSAHPRIGEDAWRLSALSAREQGQGSTEVDRLLAELNDTYEQKFGFRFVVFVNRRPKSEIVEVLRQRINGTRQEELQTGLREMLRIARDRLRALHDA
jgi:2-oxo-4-hydroxy-4-carboxy--5-ureidoimidazoline (OHCU) decarboxylase